MTSIIIGVSSVAIIFGVLTLVDQSRMLKSIKERIAEAEKMKRELDRL